MSSWINFGISLRPSVTWACLGWSSKMKRSIMNIADVVVIVVLVLVVAVVVAVAVAVAIVVVVDVFIFV